MVPGLRRRDDACGQRRPVDHAPLQLLQDRNRKANRARPQALAKLIAYPPLRPRAPHNADESYVGLTNVGQRRCLIRAWRGIRSSPAFNDALPTRATRYDADHCRFGVQNMDNTASRDFETNGWGVIPGFIDAHERALVKASLQDALAHPRPACMSRPGNDLALLRWNEPAVATILGSAQRIRRLHKGLGMGDLKWLSAYISSKAPYSPALWWHQDWWCWDHPVSFQRAATQVAVLCYLTDTDTTSGALRVLPGSHHRSTPLHRHLPEPHGDDANQLTSDHPAMADDAGQITVSVRAGDAVVIDYRLLHSTHANKSPARRDCILLSFIPNWAALPEELKAHCTMHPALPDGQEAASAMQCSYADCCHASPACRQACR